VAPITHFLASWIIAAKTTNNPRDCRLVTLAGILPDLDGLGMVVDIANNLQGHHAPHYYYYARYHHYLLHGAFGAVIIAGLMAAFARQRWRVALMSLVVFHLHLLCDLAASRGPAPEDLWPIFYFGPFDKDPMWIWKGQWPLDSWINRVITVALFFWSLWLAIPLGYSFVSVFNRKVDEIFLAVLRKWKASLVPVKPPPI